MNKHRTMAPRALWKGQLRLSLVSIPVEVFSAKDAAEVQIERPQKDVMETEVEGIRISSANMTARLK